jgi:hypothetical protein
MSGDGAVKDLVAGSGLRLGDRGVHSLKGIPGEWGIFAAEPWAFRQLLKFIDRLERAVRLNDG